MPKVLIVDDEPDMRRLIRYALGPEIEALEADGGRAALAILRREKPRLMLLDLAMPKMGGLDVLAAALKIDPGLAVMMLTGDCDIDQARRALELGARAYITKPFEPAVLYGEVQRHFELGGRPGGAEEPYRPWRVAEG